MALNPVAVILSSSLCHPMVRGTDVGVSLTPGPCQKYWEELKSVTFELKSNDGFEESFA